LFIIPVSGILALEPHPFGQQQLKAALFTKRENNALKQNKEAQHKPGGNALPIWLPKP
jgi:hypothetical protein